MSLQIEEAKVKAEAHEIAKDIDRMNIDCTLNPNM